MEPQLLKRSVGQEICDSCLPLSEESFGVKLGSVRILVHVELNVDVSRQGARTRGKLAKSVQALIVCLFHRLVDLCIPAKQKFFHFVIDLVADAVLGVMLLSIIY
jgi:hypothetical protein